MPSQQNFLEIGSLLSESPRKKLGNPWIIQFPYLNCDPNEAQQLITSSQINMPELLLQPRLCPETRELRGGKGREPGTFISA